VVLPVEVVFMMAVCTAIVLFLPMLLLVNLIMRFSGNRSNNFVFCCVKVAIWASNAAIWFLSLPPEEGGTMEEVVDCSGLLRAD
jgi:hypothetical protein